MTDSSTPRDDAADDPTRADHRVPTQARPDVSRAGPASARQERTARPGRAASGPAAAQGGTAGTEAARPEHRADRPGASALRRRSQVPWAHAALHDSFLDNRINSQQWETWGFRLVPEVKKRLELRLAADKKSADNRRLAQGHYVNAAMLHLPESMPERLRMIREFLVTRGGYTPPGKASNYRVSNTVWQVARDLDMEITAAAKRGLVVFLFSAAIERFVDALDIEGPIQPPDVFRRTQ
jgi:hypothetical protein